MSMVLVSGLKLFNALMLRLGLAPSRRAPRATVAVLKRRTLGQRKARRSE